MALGYRGAANRNGPSPIVYDLVPEAVLTGTDPGLGFGFYQNFVLGASHATTGTTVPGWIVNYVGGAGTIAAGTVEGGNIVLNSSGTEDQGMQMQTHESFYIDADSKIVFGARLSVADADQSDTYLGLSIHDTDIAQSIPDDNVGFSLVDAAADLYTNIELSGTATNTDTTHDMVDGAITRLECFIAREDSIHFLDNGVEKIPGTAVTYLPLDQQLAMSLAHVTGATATDALALYHIYCWQWYV